MLPICAILGDYQNAARSFADWSVLGRRVDVGRFEAHLGGPDAVVKALADCSIIVAMRECIPLPKGVLQHLPKLKLLVTTGMRNRSNDLEGPGTFGITVCGNGAAGNPAAELTWGRSVQGKRLGVGGLGKLGRQMVRLGQAFGLSVAGWTRTDLTARAAAFEITPQSLPELLASSDAVIVQLSLVAETRCLIGAELDVFDQEPLPLCFLASTGRGPEDFAHLAEHLAEAGLRVVLPWPRGLGDNTGPLEGIDLHDLAADAASALEVEGGPGGAEIMGHAYGCWIARTLAQDFPGLVDGIILLATGGGAWAAELSKAIENAMDITAPDGNRLAALQLGFFTEGHDPHPWLKAWSGKLVRAQRGAGARTDRDSWWGAGNAPVLDNVGLQDPFRPADGWRFYQQEFAPRCVLVAVDGASQALPDEKTAEVAVIILPWIARLRDQNGAENDEGIQT